ncbi:MAG: HEAT repeat domain-containing protein [Natronosporangium sp.]
MPDARPPEGSWRLVRAIARDAARRVGIEALDHYRTAVSAADPAPGAIAGLAETGGRMDAPLLHAFLAHPAGRVRTQAVRALRHLGAVPVEQTIRMLRDPSPAVIREATAALRPLTRTVPIEVAWVLLADPHRVECRRAAYRLLRVRAAPQQLRAALLLATDPDPGLARRAVADATRLAREAAGPGWRLSQPGLAATPAQVAELAGLTYRAAAVLGVDTTRMLHVWFAKSTPG